MEAGLMEIVGSLHRNWIYDTYFNLYRAIHPGEKSGGNVRRRGVHIPSGAGRKRSLTNFRMLDLFFSFILVVLLCILRLLKQNRINFRKPELPLNTPMSAESRVNFGCLGADQRSA